jgi:hypothetical protein
MREFICLAFNEGKEVKKSQPWGQVKFVDFIMNFNLGE